MSAQQSSQASTAPTGSSLLQRLKGSLSTQNQQLIKQSIPSIASEPQDEKEIVEEPVSNTSSLNPAYPVSGGAKEVAPLHVTVERPAVDVVPGMQAVELEKANELPPEVEGFLKTVEDNQEKIPQEIVISNPQTGQVLPRVMAQPVIVLPITPQVEEEGKKKEVTHSVRWLVEWSWKIMKVFSGKVVYRKADST